MYHWTYELHGTLFIFRWVTTYARLLYDYRSHTTCSYIHTQTWHIWLSTDCMRKYDSMRKPQKIKKIRIYSGFGVGRLFERVKARDPASYIRVHVSLIFRNMFLQLLQCFSRCESRMLKVSNLNLGKKNIEKCSNLTCSLLVLYVRIRWVSLFLKKDINQQCL